MGPGEPARLHRHQGHARWSRSRRVWARQDTDWRLLRASRSSSWPTLTEHPSDWAFVTRVWVAEGPVRPPRPWRSAQRAVHAHGVPILSLDQESTPEEVIAQLLLLAYWHGYLEGEETALIPRSLASAFPRDVARVRSGTGASDDEEAATLLFERLLRPGFDPTRGAGPSATTSRHSRTLVLSHRASEARFDPWREFDINERYYYKLLARFTERGPDGRYEVDDTVKAKLHDYLAGRRKREAALARLRSVGFGDAAARKWLQRHSLDEILTAKPRRSPRGWVRVGTPAAAPSPARSPSSGVARSQSGARPSPTITSAAYPALISPTPPYHLRPRLFGKTAPLLLREWSFLSPRHLPPGGGSPCRDPVTDRSRVRRASAGPSPDGPPVSSIGQGRTSRAARDWREPAAILPALRRDAVVVRPHPVLRRAGPVAPLHGVVEPRHDAQSGHVRWLPMSGPPGAEPRIPGRHRRRQKAAGRFGEWRPGASPRPRSPPTRRGPAAAFLAGAGRCGAGPLPAMRKLQTATNCEEPRAGTRAQCPFRRDAAPLPRIRAVHRAYRLPSDVECPSLISSRSDHAAP